MPKPTRTTRLGCEALEAREVPATFYPATVPELITAVATANGTSESDTIVLTPAATYTLTAANNSTYGPTGLPVVLPGSGSLAIVGNGAVIERSTATGTPAFRLMAVEVGASLTAENLTVQGGRIDTGSIFIPAWGGYGAAGGAVLNHGTVVLRNVTVQNNTAVGWTGSFSSGFGGAAAGGGIYSDGTLTITGGSIRNNQAVGGDSGRGMDGASGLGGGVCAGGTASLTRASLADNTAKGGAGGEGYTVYPSRGKPYRVPPGDGGTGAGGGLYARSATVTLAACTVSGNRAVGGPGGGESYGGGIYVGFGATVAWDAATLFVRNRAGTGNDFFRS